MENRYDNNVFDIDEEQKEWLVREEEEEEKEGGGEGGEDEEEEQFIIELESNGDVFQVLIENDSQKNSLCKYALNNILKQTSIDECIKKCDHTQCKSSHSLSEQIICPDRADALSIIFYEGYKGIEHHNYPDRMYQELLSMSERCPMCQRNTCTRGYNCRRGACVPGILVCLDEMQDGSCNRFVKKYDVPSESIRFTNPNKPSVKLPRCSKGWHLSNRSECGEYLNVRPYMQYVDDKCCMYEMNDFSNEDQDMPVAIKITDSAQYTQEEQEQEQEQDDYIKDILDALLIEDRNIKNNKGIF